jgi:CBS domain-containing protein
MQAPAVTAGSDSGVREAIRTLAEHGLRRLPLVDDEGKLAGMLTADDLMLVLARELFLLRSPLVAQRALVQSRPELPGRTLREHYRREVVTVVPEASAADVARAMDRECVGAVVVAGVDRRPLGVITDRDLLTRIPVGSPLPVAQELMSAPAVVVEAGASLEELIGVMQKRSIRRVPVVEDGVLVGIVTLDDLLVLLGRELADLGVAIRHSIERSRREERLQALRAALHETIDWSLDRAASLGEKAQERLGRDLSAIREQLRKRLS